MSLVRTWEGEGKEGWVGKPGGELVRGIWEMWGRTGCEFLADGGCGLAGDLGVLDFL